MGDCLPVHPAQELGTCTLELDHSLPHGAFLLAKGLMRGLMLVPSTVREPFTPCWTTAVTTLCIVLSESI